MHRILVQQLVIILTMLTMMDHLGLAAGADQPDDFAIQETRDPRDPQWSTWSEWAPCSRTCDGGATYQTRRCLDNLRGCGAGRSIRYQICNMQPCPELVDFRLQQCQSYNSIPYQGKLYAWVPHTDSRSPCSLSCRAANTSLIVQHSARVHDGTRCKPGSLDMCIDGLCQPVGCDLQLNSQLKIDSCGVCGGDGSTCDFGSNNNSQQETYRWEFGHRLSACSASCDGGEQEVQLICRETSTGLEVLESLCQPANRPAPKIVPCHTDPCPPKWVVGPWESCSVSCGGGVKERRIHCQQGRNNTRVDDVICSALIGHKARSHEPCNTHDCPSWFQGPWSQCSTPCGDDGVQTRVVVCRDARGHVTNACRDQDQPPTTRSCPSQPACPSTMAPPTTATAPNRPPRQKVTPFSLFDDDDDQEKELKGVLIHPASNAGSAPAALLSEKLQVGEISLVPTDPTFIAGEWSPCSVTCGDGTRERQVHCKIFLEFSKTIANLPDKECPGIKPAELEPCFMRPCSLSNKYEPWIGQFSDQSNYKLMQVPAGTRKPVEDLRTATKMELTSSGGTGSISVTKPSSSIGTASGSLAHTWKSSGFSQCSASCLGGVQESIIECVRELDGQRVNPHLCPMDRRPDAITRTCNDVPCPPRWNTSDFSACSRSCGGGVQTRQVDCIHEVARGGSNTLPVGPDLCPQPPPRAQQYCNMIDCPVEWKTGEWSQCSSTCEGGFKVRKVTCQQVLALGQVLTKTANHCNPTSRPAESKPCNSGKQCTNNEEEEEEAGQPTVVDDKTANTVDKAGPAQPERSDMPKIQSANQNFVQQSLSKKKVTLKIGGKASIFKGTQIKIRCPVKHYDKSKISWMKDHILLVKSHKYELNKKGMLRIRDATYSDSGVYSCIAGRSVANITLTVRPAPTGGQNSLEKDPTRSMDHEEDSVDSTGNRSHVGGHKSPEHPHRNDGASSGSSTADGRPSVDQEDELKEMKGNSLNSGQDDTKSFDPFAGPTDPANPDDSLLPGTFYSSDQDQQQETDKQTTVAPPVAKNSKAAHRAGNRSKLKNASTGHHKTGRKSNRHNDPPSSNPVILGKGKADSLKFEWLLTPWSKCSQTCGGSGFQVRAVQCLVRLNNVTKSVEANLCEDAGITDPDSPAIGPSPKQPATVQKCGLDTCPHWVAGSWTPCHQSRCFTWNTALQKRLLDCLMDNGTVLDPILCNEREKPAQKRECFNENCRGTWKVSDWSHCTATCDSVGHQSRLLRCVWYGTDSPAGLGCADLPRLPVTRPCRGPPCPKRGQCRDQSSYCGLVQTLQLCYIPQYRQHCCQTCHHQAPQHKHPDRNGHKKKKKYMAIRNPTQTSTAIPP